MIHELDKTQIEQTIQKEPMCIITFGAPWCIDCRRAEPFYKRFSEEFTDVYFTHIDVGERGGNWHEEFKLAHIPTMIFYKNGVEVDRIVEVQTPGELKAFIERCKA